MVWITGETSLRLSSGAYLHWFSGQHPRSDPEVGISTSPSPRYLCVCVHAHSWRQQRTLGVLLCHFLPYSSRQDPSWKLELFISVLLGPGAQPMSWCCPNSGSVYSVKPLECPYQPAQLTDRGRLASVYREVNYSPITLLRPPLIPWYFRNSLVVEHVLSKCEALGSVPSTTHKKTKTNKKPLFS